jgi:tetratricopeptide (TPR) repeat protein
LHERLDSPDTPVTDITASRRATVSFALLLLLPAGLLYGAFLWNPIVFDDIYFFDGSIHTQYLDKPFSLDLRWLPYATFEWTRALLGLDLIWYRLGNLALHLAVTVALFLLLRRLLEIVQASSDGVTAAASIDRPAFIAALLFSLHPVAVYGVAYLTQRSILMATLFALLTWRLFLEGLERRRQPWLLASAATYFIAVHCKEHAVMVPAVCAALVLLTAHERRGLLRLLSPVFAIYAAIGIETTIKLKTGHVLGQAYEPVAGDLLERLGISAGMAYPLSVVTQTLLYFKYLLLWLLPVSSFMSVDMYPDIARRMVSWPETLGVLAFIAYPCVALWLLLRRGLAGLLGFALLCPWLLFLTELSTVRVQESFVLYRSYLWMPLLFAALPVLLRKLDGSRILLYGTVVALALLSQTVLRLQTFSNPLLLWDDAIRLVERSGTARAGVERVYYNRGIMWERLGQHERAIADQTRAIELSGPHGYYVGHALQNRGAARMEVAQYQLALDDFRRAAEMQPPNPKAFLGVARALQALRDPAATQAYARACAMGSAAACGPQP